MLSTKILQHQVFQEKTQDNISKLILVAPSVVLDEATGIVYFGCSSSEVNSYLNTFATLYRCEKCFVSDVREHLPSFEREITIYDLQSETD